MEAIAMDDAALRQPWDGEVRLVREAILLVASGMTPRVLVAGLAYGAIVRDLCTRFALESGARLHSKPTSRPDRFDVLVEAIQA